MSGMASIDRFTDFLLPLDDQLEKLRQHNATTWENRFSLDSFEISSGHQQSVENLEILHIEGETPGETMELLWAAIQAAHGSALRLPHVRGDCISLCSEPGLVKTYAPGIYWVRIDLTQYWFRKGGVSSLAARRHAQAKGLKLAHGEVLSAFAWHPELLMQMDGRNFPSMRLAGYDLKVDGGLEVPGLWLHREDNAPRLDSFELDHVDTLDAAPVILESQARR